MGPKGQCPSAQWGLEGKPLPEADERFCAYNIHFQCIWCRSLSV